MRAFEWNALRIGDPVLIHVKRGDEFPLTHGVVTMVDVRKGENSVGVRTGDGPDVRVVRPTRLATHLEPLTEDPECWRCGR